MPPEKATSGATAPVVQEPGAQSVPQGTNLPAASEAPVPVVQEQPPAAAVVNLDELLARPEVAEVFRRRVQGEADRRANALRMQMEADRQAERERAQQQAQLQLYDQLDDEELGKARREEIKVQQQRGQLAVEMQAQHARERAQEHQQFAQEYIDSWLGIVPEKKVRDGLEEALQSGRYKSPQEFKDACQQAHDAHLEAKLTEKIGKAEAQAAHLDATARVAATAVPDLASGQPLSTTRKFRTNQERLAWAWKNEGEAKE